MPAPRTIALPHFDVEIIEDDGDWSALQDAATIINRAATAIGQSEAAPLRSAAICVVLSSDANVAHLNARFRGKAQPTNVLSFPAGEGSRDGYLGDVVLARETVEREASEQGVSLVHHVQHLVVHGVLHLLGYDHATSGDAERMEALEIEILSTLGVANPYTGALETATNG